MITLEKLLYRIHDVSSLPDVANRVIEIVNSPDSSASDLKAIVESDPALAARLLRTVNSAAYGLRGRVDTVHKAIGMLGFTAVRNLAVTASVAEVFRQNLTIGTYSRYGLWRHLVSVGVVARMAALRSGSQMFDEAFMSGLLHDVGIVMLDQYANEEFVQIVSSLNTETGLDVLERDYLGFDHAQVGAMVAESWKFPPSVVSAIRFHHAPERCKDETRPIVQSVQIANYLCAKRGISSMGIMNVMAPSPQTFSDLNFGRQDVVVLWQDMEAELKKHEEMVKI